MCRPISIIPECEQTCLNVELDHALLCGKLVQLLYVQLPEVLDVHWPPLRPNHVR